MKAETIFKNSITFDEVSRINKEKNDEYKHKLNEKNKETLSQIQVLINNCRLNNSYCNEYYICICRYNSEMDQMLSDIGFKTYRPNPFRSWAWDMDDDLFIRDDDLYKLKSSKSNCTML